MAIIGRGTVGSVLTDREDRLYFASGVSDSSETRESEFRREMDLLNIQDRSQHIVYFSSLSVFYSHTAYTEHKLRMERAVKGRFKRWCVMRLGNPVWGSNPKHLVPHLKARHAAGKALEVRDVWRYPLELEEFLFWVSCIPQWNCEMNVPGRRMKVDELVRTYVTNEA